MPQPLILVDGSSYLYRAFHAMPALMNSKGEATGAIYGVINMLRRLRKDYDAAQIAVVFDAKGKTFRDELYPEYKANRPPMPKELSQQIAPLHDIIHAMGLPLIIIDGVEADDVIGTLCQQATQAGIPTIVSTGDKDMAQLVNEHVTLINTMTEQTLDPAGVIEKFGVAPEQIIDYLTLIGDTSDNIPGVNKVGPKTAVKWLQAYGDLDNLITHADEISGKVGDNLRASLEQLPLSKQLVTIKTDVKLDLTPAQIQLQTPDKQQLIELFQRYEFKNWLAEQLDGAETKTEASYHCISTKSELDKLIQQITQAKLFAFDTETTSLNYMQAKLVGFSVALEAGTAYYIPFGHDYAGVPEQLDQATVLDAFKPILESKTPEKIGQHLKYDMSVLANYDIKLNGVRFDTMLESYVYDSTANRHDMDTLALKYLGHKTISYEEVAGKGAKQICFSAVDIETATNYAAEDADITLQLHQTLWPKLQNNQAQQAVFDDIEMPLVPVLSRMERHGVLLDANELMLQSAELAGRLDALTEVAYQLAEQTFNLSSPKQLQTILYDQLGLPVLQKTPKGVPSTAEAVLQELAINYPLPKVILEYRSLSKLKSTYTDKLPEQIDPNTDRVHTSYHQAVAATGRLSSSDPNLQNIPARTEEGRRIRKAFIAPDGYKIVAADYSQIELRIMAHLSGDAGLLDAFAHKLDIHRATASEVFGVTLDGVTAEQRRRAKAINFGLIYGMSAFGLAKQLGIERNEAQFYMDQYFARYPGVKTYMEETRKKAHEQGYVETLFGRRLNLPDINAQNKMRQAGAERAAINAPMQGTAADIIKVAMIAIDDWLQHEHPDVYMVMQVHDELVFEVPSEKVEIITPKLEQLMDNTTKLSVPIEVAIGVGDTWDDAH